MTKKPTRAITIAPETYALLKTSLLRKEPFVEELATFLEGHHESRDSMKKLVMRGCDRLVLAGFLLTAVQYHAGREYRDKLPFGMVIGQERRLPGILREMAKTIERLHASRLGSLDWMRLYEDLTSAAPRQSEEVERLPQTLRAQADLLEVMTAHGRSSAKRTGTSMYRLAEHLLIEYVTDKTRSHHWIDVGRLLATTSRFRLFSGKTIADSMFAPGPLRIRVTTFRVQSNVERTSRSHAKA